MSFIIAIDGPAGSGKGTIAKALAEKIGFIRLDTGALYRCVTLEVINNNINLTDIDKIVNIAKNMNVKFQKSDNENDLDKVFLNERDVTKSIRSAEVSKLVAEVSTIPQVRSELLKIQRNLAEHHDIIMEGRDIGTVVFPNANLKIYLDADIEERAKRRYKENQGKNINMSYEEVIENIRKRDENDKAKEIGALKKAKDSIVIDTTKLTIEEVVEKIIEIIKNKNSRL